VITEGTYLGPRVVSWLYDLVAHRYDSIKNVQFADEVQHIGAPLANRLGNAAEARVLDVACGTGRVALALRLGGAFRGTIVGLDRSMSMLREATLATCRAHVPMMPLHADAQHLPIANSSVDAVTCIEALEFFGRPELALAECWRVLKPGGILLVSNRIGRDARLLPHRHTGRGALEAVLREFGWREIDTSVWQVHYDLIWATKPSNMMGE